MKAEANYSGSAGQLAEQAVTYATGQQYGTVQPGTYQASRQYVSSSEQPVTYTTTTAYNPSGSAAKGYISGSNVAQGYTREVIQGGWSQSAAGQVYQEAPVHYQNVHVVQGGAQYQNGGAYQVGYQSGAQYQSGVQYQNKVIADEIPVESRIEYIPFEKKYVEYDQVERIERVPHETEIVEYEEVRHTERIPIEKVITDYYAVETQIEYIPKEIEETIVEYQAVERIFERVQYLPVETQIVHYPERDNYIPGQSRYIAAGSQVGQTRTEIYTGQQQGGYITGQALGGYIQGQQVGYTGGYTTGANQVVYSTGIPANTTTYATSSQVARGGEQQVTYTTGPVVTRGEQQVTYTTGPVVTRGEQQVTYTTGPAVTRGEQQVTYTTGQYTGPTTYTTGEYTTTGGIPAGYTSTSGNYQASGFQPRTSGTGAQVSTAAYPARTSGTYQASSSGAQGATSYQARTSGIAQ